jgi:hypothetical protein
LRGHAAACVAYKEPTADMCRRLRLTAHHSMVGTSAGVQSDERPRSLLDAPAITFHSSLALGVVPGGFARIHHSG